MKSMRQMQEEMLAGCRWDGSFPKTVHMGLGMIAVARDQNEHDRLMRSEKFVWKVVLGLALLVQVPCTIALVWWLTK